MLYPSATEYIDSIRDEDCFDVLQPIQHTTDLQGGIYVVSGGFATVFKVYKPDTEKHYALKCFNKHIADREERYTALSNYFKSNPRPYFMDYNYYSKELWVNSQSAEDGEYPLLQMEWVEGATLGDYIQEKVDAGDKAALKRLAKSFDELALDLLAQDFAHGDLKHDNIMVKSDGQLVLIDYDGAYVPALQGKPCEELGSAAYQHPSRSSSSYTRDLDDFSILVLSISLHALGEHLELLRKYKGSDNILFRRRDYENLAASALYVELQGIGLLSERLSLLERSLRVGDVAVEGVSKVLGHGKGLVQQTKVLIESAQYIFEEIKQLQKRNEELEAENRRLFERIKQLELGSTSLVVPKDYVLVEGGSFMMGSDDGEAYDDEKSVYKVRVDTFYMSKYAVTFEEYDAYCAATGVGKPSDEDRGRGRRPVVNVSWEDAVAYAEWLSKKEGKVYRLPTEAEWEYAARGGKLSKGYKYAGSNDLAEVAWYRDNSGRQTHEVGQKKSNELGLYDLSGNVWEWCSDWFDEEYYAKSPSANPQGPSTGSSRVLRGGGCLYSARYCRVVDRGDFSPNIYNRDGGFRLLLQANIL